jgi:hypothetical protein
VIGLTGLAVLVLLAAGYAVRGPLLMSAPACLAGDWAHCTGTFNGVVLLTLAGIPVALLVAGALARLRPATGALAWRLSLAEVGLVYGTAPWVWLTMLPGSRAGQVPGRVSLIPFHDLVTTGPLQIGGNLLVLAALGFFAPVRFAALASVWRVLLLAAVCSTTIETLQYVLQLDRVSSVDDVLVNTAGAGLAALASRRWWRGRAAAPVAA